MILSRSFFRIKGRVAWCYRKNKVLPLAALADTVYLVVLVRVTMFLFQWRCENLLSAQTPIPDFPAIVH